MTHGWTAGAAALVAASLLVAGGAGADQKGRSGKATPTATPSGSREDDVKAGADAWHLGDFTQAVDKWRPHAIAGDADAQFNLGQAYKLGRGVPLDPVLARSWFLKAANQGNLQAADNYGLGLFEDGKRAEAAPWLDKSAARGEPRAQLVLGTMLFNGDGVTRDYPRAYALMTRASQQGMKSASETLVQMDQYISPADRQHGIEMAQRLAAEQNALHVADAGGANGGRVAVPATMAPRPIERVPVAPSASSHDRPPPPPVRPRPVPALAAHAGSGWRVQLGAFRDAGNARALWSRVGGRVGGTPSYVAGGGVTRLQAGPFASRAAAEHACAAARGGCVVVAP